MYYLFAQKINGVAQPLNEYLRIIQIFIPVRQAPVGKHAMRFLVEILRGRI